VKFAGLKKRTGTQAGVVDLRFQINASGESFSGAKEVEALISYGPITGTTEYNN